MMRGMLFLLMGVLTHQACADADDAILPAPPDGLRVICRNYVRPAQLRAYESILDLEYVSGLLIYIDWARWEPRPGEYQWHYFDRPLETARQRGKKVSLGIHVQAFSPPWLLEKCATFTFRHHHPRVGQIESPVPWDSTYQSAVKRMVEALAERYDGHEALHYVVMTGPSTLFGVETNFPVAEISSEMASRLAFTIERYKAGWMQSIDYYMQSFSRTDLSLALHYHIGDLPAADSRPPPAGSLGVDKETALSTVRAIRDHALRRREERGKGGLVLRLLGLGPEHPVYFAGPYTGDDSTITDYLALVWEVRDRADAIAFEAARVFSRPNVRCPVLTPDELGKVLELGITYCPRWIEVKELDVWNVAENRPYEPYVRVLSEANQRLLQVGNETR